MDYEVSERSDFSQITLHIYDPHWHVVGERYAASQTLPAAFVIEKAAAIDIRQQILKPLSWPERLNGLAASPFHVTLQNINRLNPGGLCIPCLVSEINVPLFIEDRMVKKARQIGGPTRGNR
jgi:hypothetical protein